MLKHVEFAINNTPNASTKQIPAQMVFGDLPRLPIDLAVSRDVANSRAAQHVSAVHEVTRRARDALARAQDY